MSDNAQKEGNMSNLSIGTRRISGADLYELLREDLQLISYVSVFECLQPRRRPRLHYKLRLNALPPASLPTIGEELFEICRSAYLWFGMYHPKLQRKFQREVHRAFVKNRVHITLQSQIGEDIRHTRWMRGDARECIARLMYLLVSYANVASANPEVAPPGLD